MVDLSDSLDNRKFVDGNKAGYKTQAPHKVHWLDFENNYPTGVF
jgi:hypothetical protein